MTAHLPMLPGQLSVAQFQALADIPPEHEWFGNLQNRNTKLAYENDIKQFMEFVGLSEPTQLRAVTRAHVIAWREHLTHSKRKNDSIRRKLAALSSLYAYLCDQNAVLHNPVLGVKRPRSLNREGVTPALSDRQADLLLKAPPEDTLKGKRDRAILATLLYHAIRRQELCNLTVGDIQQRQGVMYLRIVGKGDKVRYIEAAPGALQRISLYLEAAGHKEDLQGPLFRPIKNYTTRTLNKALSATAVYRDVVQWYARAIGLTETVRGFRPHSLRATAATNTLANGSDIAKVRDWLGHADISTTTMYDKRGSRPEDSPTFNVKYG
jgi:site-specific recombinase XerD